AEVDYGRSLATFTVNSHLELLNLNLPRNLYQTNCVNNLGDAACGVNLSSYVTSPAARSGCTQSVLIFTGAIDQSLGGAFNAGKCVGVTGANAGLARTVQYTGTAYTPGDTIQLLTPFPTAPAAGDSFQVFYGCDKTLGQNGCPKFNNTPRFKGFPFVPVPVTAA